MLLGPWLVPGGMPVWGQVLMELLLGAVLVWALSFFRDPDRRCPQQPDLLLAPADGRITDIETVDDDPFIQGKALRIGIFLSIFNVHINRMPCSVRVEGTLYAPGKYKNAMNPDSSRVNESNEVRLLRQEDPQDRIKVRQISGAIARRIICGASPGQDFAAGERFGMIKFGSRTELYIAHSDKVQCCVKIGDKVKAGLTVLAKYR